MRTSTMRAVRLAAACMGLAAAMAWAQEKTGAAPVEAQSAQQPRRLSAAELAKLRTSVQKSKARNAEEVARARRQQQEAARQWERQQQEMANAEAQRQAMEAEADAEFEAERAQKAAQWERQKHASERALAGSIQRLNDTTAQVQARQTEDRARQEAPPAGLIIESVAPRDPPPAPSPALPARSAAVSQPSDDEPRMGFPGPTCAVARAGAQRWVGSGGTYEVAEERIDSSGWCTVQIRNWKQGAGTASAQ